MNVELSKDFVHELYKICLKKPSILKIADKFVKYQYLPGEEYKLVWRSIINYYDVNGTSITVGIISQTYIHNDRVQTVLSRIKSAELLGEDECIVQLKEFIRLNLFIDSYDKIGELYSKGDKDSAIALLKESYEELESFSIKSKIKHVEIISTLPDRLAQRKIDALDVKPEDQKLPTGIPVFDSQIGGGIDKGDTLCLLAGSGVGKSKFLKWVGISNVRRGSKILHIQLEGSEEEAVDTYDAGITGIQLSNLEKGLYPDKTIELIELGM